MLIIDISWALEDWLRANGWTRRLAPYPRGSAGRLFSKGNRRIIYVPYIPIKPSLGTSITQQCDDFFRRLCDALTRLLQRGIAIGPIVFQGGGNIPIPKWFTDFCAEHSIIIIVIKPDDFNEKLKEMM